MCTMNTKLLRVSINMYYVSVNGYGQSIRCVHIHFSDAQSFWTLYRSTFRNVFNFQSSMTNSEASITNAQRSRSRNLDPIRSKRQLPVMLGPTPNTTACRGLQALEGRGVTTYLADLHTLIRGRGGLGPPLSRGQAEGAAPTSLRP